MNPPSSIHTEERPIAKRLLDSFRLETESERFEIIISYSVQKKS